MSKPILRIIQINDVYEIGPLSKNEGSGGLARVSAYLKSVRAQCGQHPECPVLFVMTGDLLSPSVFNAVKINNEFLAGRHMVEFMNYMALDLALLGNHEFDLNPVELEARMSESSFKWLNGNLRYKDGPIKYADKFFIKEVQIPESDQPLKLAFLGLSIGSGKSHVEAEPVIEKGREYIEQLKSEVDAFIALTHLQKDEDLSLVKELPEICLVLGGHEHEGIYLKNNGVNITKAKSNARSLFDHTIYANSNRELRIESVEVDLDESATLDEELISIMNEWRAKVHKALKDEGFKPERVLCQSSELLNGLDAHMRVGPTNLGTLVARAMFHTFKQADLAFISGGALRLDDIIQPGPVTEYDALRLMPYENKINCVVIPGGVIRSVLRGQWAFTKLSYYHRYNIEEKGDEFFINGELLDQNRHYNCVMTDYLQRRLSEHIVDVLPEFFDLRTVIMSELELHGC